MKILYLSNIPSPYRVDYFNELGKFCDLTVVYQAEKNPNLNANWFSEKVQNFNHYFLQEGNINEKTVNLRMIKYLKRNKYDLIVVSSYSNPTEMFSIFLLNLLKIPFVLEVDGGLVKRDSLMKKKVKEFFISSAAYWLSTSEETDKYLTYYGAKIGKIYRYPFTSLRSSDIISVPLNQSEKDLLRKELDIEEKKIALSVGQLIERKGFDVLINSWGNSEYELIIIGDGELKEKLNLQIKKMNLTNVKIIDFMDKKDLMKYYKAADVFILPTREDIWGLVINEAMSNGLPIITTEKCIAGRELVIEEANGFIVPVNNSKALEMKTNIILSNDVLKKSMSQKSIDIIKKYSIESMAQVHLEIFSSILKNPHR